MRKHQKEFYNRAFKAESVTQAVPQDYMLPLSLSTHPPDPATELSRVNAATLFFDMHSSLSAFSNLRNGFVVYIFDGRCAVF